MKPLLEATGLIKHFKTTKAVDGIDLQLFPGECLALLGPNGAGKTTTVEMLEGLIEPDQGKIEIFGQDLNQTNHRSIMEKVGVTLQENQLYKKNTVRETIALFRSFFTSGLSVDEAIQVVQLEEKADDRLENLSGGQKQRTYLACALINNPDLIFLDEPTTGLDPQSRRSIWKLLEHLKTKGKSILLTTHYMDEAAYLADRIAIVDHGKVIAKGTPEELIKKHCGEQILKFSFTVDVSPNQLQQLPWGSDIKSIGEDHEVASLDPMPMILTLNEFSKQQELPLKGFEIRRSTLEDVFLTLTGRSMRDA